MDVLMGFSDGFYLIFDFQFGDGKRNILNANFYVKGLLLFGIDWIETVWKEGNGEVLVGLCGKLDIFHGHKFGGNKQRQIDKCILLNRHAPNFHFLIDQNQWLISQTILLQRIIIEILKKLVICT